MNLYKIKKFFSEKENQHIAILIGLGLVILLLGTTLYSVNERRLERRSEVQRVQEEKATVEQELNKAEVKTKELNLLHEQKAKEVKKQDQEISRLKVKLQAKKTREASEVRLAVSKPEPQPRVKVATNFTGGSTGNCGDNQYKQFIYKKESGCDTAARNAGGCFGIGQACPGSKVAHCGTNFACQDKWFTNYAISVYGSWEKAYNAWLSKGWW